jgi:hypothetical protein
MLLGELWKEELTEFLWELGEARWDVDALFWVGSYLAV